LSYGRTGQTDYRRGEDRTQAPIEALGRPTLRAVFVSADAYDRFMGRYSVPLASQFADFARLDPAGRVLEVGCGPGALTGELVRRLAPEQVTAVDPSEPFVAATAARYPGVEVEQASAEALPFDDETFDAAVAQLVVHFMADPVEGLREMGRVTRPGGVVAACVWDMSVGPLGSFWEAARRADPDAPAEQGRPGTREGHLAELFTSAGLAEVEDGVLTVALDHPTFEDWWEPFTLGVGPVGVYLANLDRRRRAAVEASCRRQVGDGPFTVTARAWSVRGSAVSR
jgi:SAM-dependent methyltransferase